jgi:hypothetical protein
MFTLLKASLVLVFVVSAAWGSEVLSSKDESISHKGSNEPAWNTQAYLEEMLRKQGALKQGQHLALHEVWELSDILKARVKERKRLQAH